MSSKNGQSNKIIYVVIPVLALLVGYSVYTEFAPKKDTPVSKVEDNLFDVPVKNDSVSTNRAEAYKEKWKREKELSRKVENDEDFFDLDRKEPAKVDEMFKEEPVKEVQSKPIEKPKVVFKYIEKPQVTVAPSKEPEPVKKSKRFVEISRTGNMGQADVVNDKPSLGRMVQCKAIVHNDQKLFNGSSIVLRLTEDLRLENAVVPKHSFVTGIVSFGSQRATVVVHGVSYNDKAHNVQLKAFDARDGVEGLYIPGGTSQDASNDVLNDVVTTATRAINVPLLQRSATSIGQRKVNEQSVNFTNGYEVILKN